MSPQTLRKCIFLESTATKQRRAAFMKQHQRLRKRASLRSSRRRKKQAEAEPVAPSTVTNPDGLEQYARTELLSQISTAFLPVAYGGEAAERDMFSFVDPLASWWASRLRMTPKGFEEYTANEHDGWTRRAALVGAAHRAHPRPARTALSMAVRRRVRAQPLLRRYALRHLSAISQCVLCSQ